MFSIENIGADLEKWHGGSTTGCSIRMDELLGGTRCSLRGRSLPAVLSRTPLRRPLELRGPEQHGRRKPEGIGQSNQGRDAQVQVPPLHPLDGREVEVGQLGQLLLSKQLPS